MPLRRVSVLAAVAAVAGCHHPAPPRATPPSVRYVVGAPWQGANGTWFYPREQPGFAATGLATVEEPGRTGLTADGERADQHLPAAAMQTLPLPAVVSVRALSTGRTVLLRVNDRGPGDPKRLIALTPAAASLLGLVPGRPAAVEVRLDEARTREAVSCAEGHPALELAAAPVQSVSEQALPPPGSAAAGGTVTRNGGAGSGEGDRPGACDASLPAAVTVGPIRPASLMIDAGTFSGATAAATQAARTGGRVERSGSGRGTSYAVRLGPFPDAAMADAALDRLLSAGVTGARITVE